MIPATDERLTIEPPVSFIARTASRQPRNTPSALTALTLRKSASVVVSILPRVAIPALLTRMSRRPKAAMTSSTTSRQRASSVTSCPSVRSASGPSAFRPASLRSLAATLAPSAWNRAAVARPMPDAAPVMSATFPASVPPRFPALFPSVHRVDARPCAGLGPFAQRAKRNRSGGPPQSPFTAGDPPGARCAAGSPGTFRCVRLSRITRGCLRR